MPYLDHGRNPDGWDCYGLVYYLSNHVLRVPVPSYFAAYPDAEDSQHVRSAIEYHCREWLEIPRDGIRCGDTLVFNLGGLPIHCGLACDAHTMLHCLAGHETVIERFDGPRWDKRLSGVFRWM